jgi:peptidase E
MSGGGGAGARHIVAMGGGGFSVTGHLTDVDRYVLKLSGKESPKVCFIPTASGDAEGYVWKFYEAFQAAGYEATHLPLFSRDEEKQMAERISSCDVIYVGGGNTANMLSIWNLHGVAPLLKDAYQRGTVMSGVSAGGMCWFEFGLTDSFGPSMKFFEGCLGWVKGAFCPHFDSEEFRRQTYQQELVQHRISGWGVDDDIGLHFVDEQFVGAVGGAPGKKAYLFELHRDSLHEAVMEPKPV